MDSNITEHMKSCHKWQAGKSDHRPAPVLLTLLPSQPNQTWGYTWIFSDLSKTWVMGSVTSSQSRMPSQNMLSLFLSPTRKLHPYVEPFSINGFVAIQFRWKSSLTKVGSSAMNSQLNSTSCSKCLISTLLLDIWPATAKQRWPTKPLQNT